MRRPGCWGGELELVMLSRIYHFDYRIYHDSGYMNVSDPVPGWVQQAADSNTHVRTIHLAFSGPLDEGHYESLRFETSAQDLVPVERIVNLQPLDEVFGVLNPSNKRGAHSIAKP